MKRKLFFIAVIVICLSLTAYGTLAFFTAEDTAHNVITTGNVDIILVDSIKDGEKTENGWSLSGVMPGQQVTKPVSVKNTGSGEAWIRVKVTLDILGADQEELPQTIETQSGKFDVVSYVLDSDDWQLHDGFVYYTKPVPAGKSTNSLFKDDIVQFAKQMGNEYQNCHVSIYVEAEAVQTANNGKTVLDAKGWPNP